jgi:L-amino acid N-acyltransferase YncA
MLDSGKPLIRDVARPDFEVLASIYAHYVLHSAVTFEVTPPTAEELASRAEAVVGQDLPFLVVEVDGDVLGFAFCGPYRSRPAYRSTVEESTYVAPQARGRGLGRLLLAGLLERCRAAGVRQVVAVIADTGDPASIRLHEACGFRVAGSLRGVGYKHGRWLDTVLMQHSVTP